MAMKKPRANMAVCPSAKDYMRNIFTIKSTIKDEIKLPCLDGSDGTVPPPANNQPIGESKVALLNARESSFDGYTNLVYNLRWLFFSEESLNVRVTAPFFPERQFCNGSIFSIGEMDIGKWYRHINLDYHIPNSTREITVEEDQDLMYLQFMTTKKIELKRYILTDRLLDYANEMSTAAARYGRFWPLDKKYGLANKSSMRDLILKEIKNNLV